uniref:Uncharacterized protein LOC111104325 isoform X2 n=1 Tax=Crassostrea virginica TaxID=6565 RepID=A0A8B8ARW8_CRAVI|nr:uncharacterized protein LOC111104325 isoform X2 [Crassostrea virginica]
MENIFIVVIAMGFLSIAACDTASKCHGNNYMNSDCKDKGVIAIKRLVFGSKSYVSEDCPLQVVEITNGTCCNYEEGDCLKNITDYQSRHMYLSSMSGLEGMSQNVATPWDRLECGNRTFSNFVQVEYNCIKKSSLTNICTYQKLVSTNGSIYLHRPMFYDGIPSTCECTIEASKRNATLTVSAIDVRLQPKHVYDTNLTGHCPENSTINLTFREGNVSSSSYECSNETIFAEYTTLYSSRGNVLNLSYTEGELEPQKVWILVKASSGKLELECNPQLSTTTTTTTSRNPGLSHSHNSGNTTGNNRKTPAMPGKTSKGPVKHDSGETGTSAHANRRAVQNTVLYAVIGLAGLSAIFIITAGVYIRRMRRSREHHRKLTAILSRSDSSPVKLDTLQRENPGFNYNSDSPTDYMY